MRVFLDECVDWRLARYIAGHDVKTARQMGWTAIKNGQLLALASKQFDAFITVDRNLAFQQNVSVHPIAVLVLGAKTNRLRDLIPLTAKLQSVIGAAQPGTVVTVDRSQADT